MLISVKLISVYVSLLMFMILSLSLSHSCLNACTYCKTKHARGDLASYPIEELVERAQQSFQGESDLWPLTLTNCLSDDPYHVILEHKTSLKSLGYICSNSQQYIVWVKIIDVSFMPQIIRILRSCSMKIFCKFPTVNISKHNFD